MAVGNQAETQLDQQIRAQREHDVALLSLDKNVQEFMDWDENDQTARDKFVENLPNLNDKQVEYYMNLFEREAAITPEQKAERNQAQSFSVATAASALGAPTMDETVVASAERMGVSGIVAEEGVSPQENSAERALVLAEIEQKLRSPSVLDALNRKTQELKEQFGDVIDPNVNLVITEDRIPEVIKNLEHLSLEDLKAQNSDLGAFIDIKGNEVSTPAAETPLAEASAAEAPSMETLSPKDMKPFLEPAQDWKDMLRTDFDASKGAPLMSPAVEAPSVFAQVDAELKADDAMCVPGAPVAKEDGFVFSQTQAVGEIQTFLIARDHEELAKPDGTPTTIFGVRTAKALSEELKELQGQWGVEQTGRYDQETRTALRQAIETHQSNSEYTSADNLELLERGLNAMQDHIPEGQPGKQYNALDIVYNKGSIEPPAATVVKSEPCAPATVIDYASKLSAAKL